jgi:hypothetical protein
MSRQLLDLIEAWGSSITLIAVLLVMAFIWSLR